MAQLPKDHAGTPIVDPVPNIDGDHKVLVDGADTTPDYLYPKLAAGTGIALTVLNPGGYEQVQIAVVPGAGDLVANRINTGNTGGTKLVDIVTTALPNGSLASVASVGALFRLETAPTAAVLAATDGITVVQPVANPAHRWVRIPTSNDVNFAYVASWFLDAAAGSDDNDGLTALTALKTTQELARRLAGLVIGQNTTVAAAAGAYGDAAFTFKLPDSLTFVFSGAVTSSAADTITAVTAAVPATNTRGAITGTAPVWVDKSRLRLTSGALSGAIAVVTRIIGGAQANVSRWGRFASATSTTPTIGEPAINDTYVVDTLGTSIGELMLSWQGDGEFVVKDCVVNGSAQNIPGSWIVPRFMNCIFNATSGRTDFDYCEVFLLGCQALSPVSVEYSIVACRNNVFEGDVNVDFEGSLQMAYSHCFDGATLTAQHSSIVYDQLLSADVQFVDILAGNCVTVSDGACVNAAVSTAIFWGANNACASAIRVGSNASFLYLAAAKPVIPGGAVDTIIGGVNVSYAALPFFHASLGASIVDLV